MARALSVDRVVRVGINLQPMAAARRNFGTLLIIGASGAAILSLFQDSLLLIAFYAHNFF